jgi:hypothetical protein
LVTLLQAVGDPHDEQRRIRKKDGFHCRTASQIAADIQELKATQVQTENVVARLAYVTLEGFKVVNVKD